MKFLALLLLPLSALAAPAPRFLPAGLSHYSGHFTLMQKSQTEAVYAFTAKGRERLAELQNRGFICTHVERSIYRCAGFLSTEGAEQEVQERLNQSLKGVSLNVGEEMGAPELVAEGDAYLEWLVKRPVSFRGVNYENYRYGILQGSLHKISLGNPADEGFLVKEDGSLEYVTTIRIPVSREVILHYFVRAAFTR